LEATETHSWVHKLDFFLMKDATVPQPPVGSNPAFSFFNSFVAFVLPAATFVSRKTKLLKSSQELALQVVAYKACHLPKLDNNWLIIWL
jgi:hypothetical protein